MRARDLRDVIEVLIVPSLERALNELNKPRGNRRRARLLVQQSVDQLYGMMVIDKKPETVEERCRAATDQSRKNRIDLLEHDFVGDDPGEFARCRHCLVIENTIQAGEPCPGGVITKHEFKSGMCRCGVIEGSEASVLSCPGEDHSEPADVGDQYVEHEFKNGLCRCGVVEGSVSAASALSCPCAPMSEADATDNPAWRGTRAGS